METFWTFVRPKYLLVLLLSVVADFVAAIHIYGLAQDWMTITLFSGFLLPYVQYLGNVWFIDARTTTERMAITFHSALGIVLGTAATLLLVGKDV